MTEEPENLSKERCPKCSGETEFVQFGGVDSPTVETEPDDVSDGLVALYYCLDCTAGLEYILTPATVTVVETDV